MLQRQPLALDGLDAVLAAQVPARRSCATVGGRFRRLADLSGGCNLGPLPISRWNIPSEAVDDGTPGRAGTRPRAHDVASAPLSRGIPISGARPLARCVLCDRVQRPACRSQSFLPVSRCASDRAGHDRLNRPSAAPWLRRLVCRQGSGIHSRHHRALDVCVCKSKSLLTYTRATDVAGDSPRVFSRASLKRRAQLRSVNRIAREGSVVLLISCGSMAQRVVVVYFASPSAARRRHPLTLALCVCVCVCFTDQG